MIRRNRIVLGIASLGLAVGLGYAIRARASGIPATNALSYAGVLDDANGPITGSHSVQVILYDAATAGTVLCQTTAGAMVTVTNGQFSVQLPDACTSAVGGNPNAWIDVLVDGADTGRTKIGAVPYAVEANHTPNADNATNAATANAAGGPLAQQIVPSGTVMFFNLAACPSGWSAVAAAQGRYLVGLPASGTLGGTAGTALSNEENRAVGQHSHTVNETPHTHSITDPGHDHQQSACGTAGGSQPAAQNFGNTCSAVGGSGYTFNAVTNIVGTNPASTGITIANAGTVAGTNAPYIQYLVCQKN